MIEIAQKWLYLLRKGVIRQNISAIEKISIKISNESFYCNQTFTPSLFDLD